MSLCLVEDMLLEHGIVVSYETIRRWGIKFGPDYARRLRRKQPSRNDVWHLDEVVITIAGRKHWLWRAVDQDGYVLDEINAPLSLHIFTACRPWRNGKLWPWSANISGRRSQLVYVYADNVTSPRERRDPELPYASGTKRQAFTTS